MVELILIVIGLATLWGLYRTHAPLWWSEQREVEQAVFGPELDKLEELGAKRAGIIQQLRDLEADYTTGKLDEQTYRHTRERLEHRGVQILKQIERLERQGDQNIPEAERLIEKHLSSLAIEQEDDAEVPPSMCPECSREVSPTDQFCRHCGSELTDTNSNPDKRREWSDVSTG